jgi:hypothetical protein
MNRFIKFGLFALLTISILGCRQKENDSHDAEWISLFNGKDLSGWHPKIKGYEFDQNPFNTFRVSNGALVVSYDEYESFNATFGHIFYKNSFSSYKLRLQYRFVGDQAFGGEGWAIKNSGVMIHSQSPESMGLNQDFPVSLEVQLLGGLEPGKERPTANLCTPGTHVMIKDSLITKHCINSNSKTFYGEEWVNLEILVIKDSIMSHSINGDVVISYSKPRIGGEYNTLVDQHGDILKEGYISLQSESHPIEFRNIELLELDK